jgi:hypothetical protein
LPKGGSHASQPDGTGYLLPRVEIGEMPFAIAYGQQFRGYDFMYLLRDLGVARTSLKVHWWMIESPNNSYHYEYVDAFMDQLEPGEEGLLHVWTSSNWGAGGCGKGLPPLDYDEYREFIYNLVSHCKGRIKYYQRDMEPGTKGHWPEDLYEEYVITQQVFYQAVKDADPDAIVIGGGHSGYFPGGVKNGPCAAVFFEYFLANAQHYFDILDIRLYMDPYTIPGRVNWFRDKMQQFGYSKPIVATEHGGPHPCQFDGWDLVKRIRKFLQEGGCENESEYLEQIQHMIENKEEYFTPAQIMFFGDCGPELDAKRDRIHARDITQRSLLLLASGVQYAWYWNLQQRWQADRGPHPLYGKLRLIDMQNGEYEPAYDRYKKMVQELGAITAVALVDTGVEGILLFEVERGEDDDLFVIWERRDFFDGEDEPATPYDWVAAWPAVKVSDVFGNEEIFYADGNGIVTLQVTDTPLFLEEYVY